MENKQNEVIMALICIIALIVFAVMSIFSAKYKAYAKEAFHCFINTMRLRKCDTGLDEKIKAEIVARLMPISVPAAKVVHSNFELLSSLFVLILLASSIYSMVSVYNFVVYGNCNGQQGGFCVLSDIAGVISSQVAKPLPPENMHGQIFGNENYKVVVYEFGCYSCSYTANVEPIVQKLYSEYRDNVKFVYKTLPISDHPFSYEAALASWCAYEQGTTKYMDYRQKLFGSQTELKKKGPSVMIALAQQSGLDMKKFVSCYETKKYANEIDSIIAESKQIGIYGTPTFYIGSKHYVGTVTYEELKAAIESELAK